MVADLRENSANIPRKLLAAVALMVAGVLLALFVDGWPATVGGILIVYGLALAAAR